MPLHKVGETKDSIIVRGARLLATLAPYADEQTVYPGAGLPPDAPTEYALSFTVRMDTPGLVFLCRDSGLRANADPVDAPFSTRFDEQDAYCIFDDVEVPKENVWIDGNIAVYNQVMAPSSWWPNIMQQTTTRALVKLEFAYGLACRMAEAVNDTSERTMEILGELLGYVEMTRSALTCAIDNAQTWESGAVYCEGSRAAPSAVAPAGLVHSDQRPSEDHRQPQPAGDSKPTPVGRPPAPPAHRRVHVRRERHLGRGPHHALPDRLGLHRLGRRQPRRAVRAQLPAVGAIEPDGVPAAPFGSGSATW